MKTPMQGERIVMWSKVKRPFIGALVTLHFIVGICTFLPTQAAPRRWPLFGALINLYQAADFTQTWKMFAPPAQDVQEIGVSFQMIGGWSHMQSLDDQLRDSVRGRWLGQVPRGMIRLANHLRPPQLVRASLEEDPVSKFYFQQLSTYFCSGQGRIPGLRKLRFYLIVHGIEPFYPEDDDGKAVPHAVARDRTQALYERDCTPNKGDAT